ncbi:MAG: CDP-alcohol phosphatidyltransferase family protein [Vicinamibacterales bacterium]
MTSAPRPTSQIANAITGVRLALAVALWAVPATSPWTLVTIGAVAAVLDAVDGPVARRTGGTSRAGARFDMETDAFLIATLAVLVWRLGKAGPWVILSGALRYLFVAGGWIWPWLDGDLPPSRRRQAVCVVQVVALVVALAPIVSPPLSAPLSAGALALLAWSFWVDVAWLARRARSQRPGARG